MVVSYNALSSPVHNRGKPSAAFLDELVEWGRNAPDDIFAGNEVYDIYSSVFDELGPYRTVGYRRAVMLEVLRVLAGFESSWDWNEGRDTTNTKSFAAKTTEAGAFQVSADSMRWGEELRTLVIARAGSDDPQVFQHAMKSDHGLAMEYAARLLRKTVNHHGPVKHNKIHPWLKKGAVQELMELLNLGSPVYKAPDVTASQTETSKARYLSALPRPTKQGINRGLNCPSSSFMTSLLGLPRDDFTGKCQKVVNEHYLRKIDTRNIGPITVTGLSAALDSLEDILRDVERELPDLHALVGTEGMLCCRYKKISGDVVNDPSNHSFGTAIDIKLGRRLDSQGDDRVQLGLLILSRYFNAHGWYWGAAFKTEDAMHFEVARETLQRWRDDGRI